MNKMFRSGLYSKSNRLLNDGYAKNEEQTLSVMSVCHFEALSGDKKLMPGWVEEVVEYSSSSC